MSSSLLSGESTVINPDPRQGLLYQENPVYDILKPCDFVFPNMVTSNNVSTSQIVFNLQVPNKNIIIPRRLAIAMTATFKLTGNSGVAANAMIPSDLVPHVVGGVEEFLGENTTFVGTSGQQASLNNMGLRCNPLHSVTTSLNLYVNQQSVTTQPNSFIPAYNFFTDRDDIVRGQSGQPVNPDNRLIYSQMAGATNSPLSNNNSYYESTRQAVSWQIVASPDNIPDANPHNNQNVGIIQFSWIEEVMISPLQWANNMSAYSKGLVGVNQLQIVYTLGNIQNMLSLDPNYYFGFTTVPTIQVYFPPQLQLYCTFLTGSPDYGPIPRTIAYNVLNPVTYQTPYGLVTGQTQSLADPYNTGTSITVQSNGVQLSSVPSKILIYVGRNLADQGKNIGAGGGPAGPYVPDTFLTITNLNITWNAYNGLLSGASPWELWKMSIENGLEFTPFYDWYYSGKCVICVSLDKNIGLPGLAVSATGQYQLAVQVQATNYIPNSQITVNPASYGAYNATLYVVVLSEQQLKISENQTTLEGSYDPLYILQDLAQGKVSSTINYAYDGNMIGGAFWDRFKDIGKRALSRIGHYIPAAQQVIRAAAPYLPDSIAPYAVTANRVLSGVDKLIAHLVGQGVSRKKLHEMFRGQVTAKEIDDIIMSHGGSFVGGAKAHKKRLHRY